MNDNDECPDGEHAWMWRPSGAVACFRCGYAPTPVACSHRGHDTHFRTGYKDGCDTCGVKW